MFFLAFAESIQLLPDGTLLIHIALILTMIWILNRTFFKPINRIIETRVKNEGGRSSEAEKILKEASEKEGEYNKELRETRSEGYELIEKERNEAVVLKQERVAEAKTDVAEMLETELKELETQTATAENAIAEEAEKMAEKISANILKTI